MAVRAQGPRRRQSAVREGWCNEAMSSSLDEIDGDDHIFLRRTMRPPYERGHHSVRLVDLFAGSGGLTLGVAEACRRFGRGLEVRLAMEWDEHIRGVYDLNFGSSVARERGDVCSRFDRAVGRSPSASEERTRAEVGKVDILVGGPPCQGHSDLNNHTRRKDEKNELYLVMVRAAEVLGPTYLMIENVQGVRRDHRAVLDRATRHLQDIGYEVEEALVRMVDIGVPQKRVRHILVAARGCSIGGVLDLPAIASPRSLKWAIGDLQGRTSDLVFDSSSRLTPENLARANLLLRRGLYDLPNRYRPPCHRDNPTHRYTAMYGRLSWDEPAHTITTGFGSPGQGRFLHPSEPRTLTPHEAARVQFFPDWFTFGSATTRKILSHCIGNAVPPKLAYAVVTRLLQRTAGKPVDAAPEATRNEPNDRPNRPRSQTGKAA
ncbi:DNA cytosine methyltransferase [Hyalangium minutum]